MDAAELDVCGVCEGTETDPANCGCEFEVISLGSASIDAGDSFEIPISICNDDFISGIQIEFNDIPDWLDVIDVVATERMDGLTLSWNTLDNGVTVITGFSLTLEQLSPGDGPIAYIQYISKRDIYEAQVVLDIVVSLLSDEDGLPIDHDAINGFVSIEGEELPVAPQAPTGLTALEGENIVELSWNASANTDMYYIYREQQSAGGGGTGGGTTGGGGDGVGESCGDGLVYDCQLQCVEENTALSWIGDGFL